MGGRVSRIYTLPSNIHGLSKKTILWVSGYGGKWNKEVPTKVVAKKIIKKRPRDKNVFNPGT